MIYLLFFNVIFYILFSKCANKNMNLRLVFILIIIMYLGYIGRFFHSKDIYSTMNNDDKLTRDFINQHYNSWIFLG